MTAAAPLLSVLVPSYNEARTLSRVLDAVLAVDVDMELILVDDGSTDATWRIMSERADGVRVRAHRHAGNRGKGAAVRTALADARGEYVLIQDADLEYDPRDYVKLLEPVVDGRAHIVFGSRPFSAHSSFSYWYVMGNRWLTSAASILYNRYLTDMQTCYKLMPRRVALALELEASGFDIDPEITAKLLRLGHRIYEVPISYVARTRAEGKKVTVNDGVRALRTLVRYRFWQPRRALAEPVGGAAAAPTATGEDASAGGARLSMAVV